MPRFKPKQPHLVIAVEDIPDASPGLTTTGYWAYRGQVFRDDHEVVQRHRALFEPAPTDVRDGPEPRADELAAISRVHFKTAAGVMIFAGRRFYPYDGLVRENPAFFQIVVPFDR